MAQALAIAMHKIERNICVHRYAASIVRNAMCAVLCCFVLYRLLSGSPRVIVCSGARRCLGCALLSNVPCSVVLYRAGRCEGVRK